MATGTDKVRIGVVGTSWWVDLMYVPSLTSHPLAHTVAVCGRNHDRAIEIASKFGGARVFHDYRQLLKEGGCDAVVIATPDDLHCEMTLAALDAGLHVLCEKPLAGNVADARRMEAQASAAGVRNMVLFTWRAQPHWRYLKQLVADGYIGRCRHAEFRFLGEFALEPGYKWRFDGRRANGVTGDLGSHLIDLARWCLGDISAVRADLRSFVDQSSTADPSPLPANDAGFLSLEFEGGARADIVASAVTLLGDEGVRITASLYGDDGSLEIRHPFFGQDAGPVVRGVRRGGSSFTTMPVPDEYFAGGARPGELFDPYLRQSAGPRRFVDAIAGGMPVETDFSVGVAVQEVVDAALASAAERRWITLRG